MATINKTPSGTFKVLIRKAGLPPQIKTFKSKSNAEKWARLIESEIDRGVFVNRQEADRVTVGELIDRYIQEVTPGFSPDFTDTSKKADNESGGVSWQGEGNTQQSSSRKRYN
jgi:hypothetical protein